MNILSVKRRRGWLGGALAGLMVAVAWAEPSTEPLAVRAFFEPPLLRAPQLSPDGKRVATFVRRGDAEAAAIIDLATGALTLQGGDEADALEIQWNSAEELILRVADRKRENFGLVGVNVVTGARRDLWRLLKAKNTLLLPLSHDPDRVLVSDEFETRYFDLKSGRMTAASPRTPVGAAWWILDETGEARASFGLGSEKLFLMWRAPGATEWQYRANLIDERPWMPVGVARDSRYVWVVEHAGVDARGLLRLDTTTGETDRALRLPGRSPINYWRSGRNGRLIAVVFDDNGSQRVTACEPEEENVVATLADKLRGFQIDVLSAPPGVSRWVVSASNSRVPAAYFFYDTQSGALSLIGMARGGDLPESRLVAPRSVEFAARDGSRRTGLVWLPPGVERPPIILSLPGFLPQPVARDAYEPEIQALVSRGMAVARINTRGTAGFERTFEEAPLEDLAGVVGDDLEDAVNALAAADLVDAKRVALAGHYLGGALALAVAERHAWVRAVVNAEAPLEVSRYDLRVFGLTLTSDAVRDQLGGWREEGKAARRLSPEVVAPALRVPNLHLYPEDAAFRGRLNQNGKRMERLLAGDHMAARVEIGRRYSDDRKLPSVEADERADVVERVIRFLQAAWSREKF